MIEILVEISNRMHLVRVDLSDIYESICDAADDLDDVVTVGDYLQHDDCDNEEIVSEIRSIFESRVLAAMSDEDRAAVSAEIVKLEDVVPDFEAYLTDVIELFGEESLDGATL